MTGQEFVANRTAGVLMKRGDRGVVPTDEAVEKFMSGQAKIWARAYVLVEKAMVEAYGELGVATGGPE